MSIKDYSSNVINDFIEAEDQEVQSNRNLEFDIGVDVSGNSIEVNQESANRIKFTLEVKRA